MSFSTVHLITTDSCLYAKPVARKSNLSNASNVITHTQCSVLNRRSRWKSRMHTQRNGCRMARRKRGCNEETNGTRPSETIRNDLRISPLDHTHKIPEARRVEKGNRPANGNRSERFESKRKLKIAIIRSPKAHVHTQTHGGYKESSKITFISAFFGCSFKLKGNHKLNRS